MRSFRNNCAQFSFKIFLRKKRRKSGEKRKEKEKPGMESGGR